MGDSSAASIWGWVFDELADAKRKVDKQTVPLVSEARDVIAKVFTSLAKRMRRESARFDFCEEEMDCDDAMRFLGLKVARETEEDDGER